MTSCGGFRARHTPIACKLDLKIIFRRHERPRSRSELTNIVARHVVNAVDFIKGETLHQSVVQHHLNPLAPFLSGLENETDSPVKTTLFCQDFCGT